MEPVTRSFDAVLVATIARFVAIEFTELVRVNKTDTASDDNRVVFNALWRFVLHFIGKIALSNWKHTLPPKCFLGLLSEKNGVMHEGH